MSAASTKFPAAVAPIGSQLAAGAILTCARRFFSIQIAADRLPGGDQAATLGFLPHRSPPQFSRSSKHQPTHNIRGCSSERNEVGVVRDADLRAERRAPTLIGTLGPQVLIRLVGLAHRHPSVRSPVTSSVVMFGPRNSEHESKELADDGNLTAQRIKLTAGDGNAKG